MTHITTKDVFERDNYIFVSFEPGGKGHTLGRVLCSLPSIHWYSNADNGKFPWNISHSSIRERNIAKRHFNRMMPNGVMLPPTHDYVKNWIPDADEYYTKHFVKQYCLADALNYSENLLFCSHEIPTKLLEVFPNSKIINIVADPITTAKRYMQTTAIFPGWLKHDWINGRQTEYGKHLIEVSMRLGKDFTVQDLWEYSNSDSYYEYIKDRMEENMHMRNKITDDRVLTVTGREYGIIKEFLN